MQIKQLLKVFFYLKKWEWERESFFLLLNNFFLNSLLDILARLSRGERLVDYEARLRCKDGTIKHVLIDSSVLFSDDGQFLHTRCFTRDVTEKRRMEEELRKAKEEAEAANKTKDHFLAVLSHELRTPLTPIVMMLPLLSEDFRLPVDVREQLSMVCKNLDLETRLIDDLLDSTAISRGRVQLCKSDIDFHQLVWQTLQLLTKETDQKALSIEFRLNARRRTVHADPMRLEQVIRNVIRNAIKYSPSRGAIRVQTSNIDDINLELEITDNGDGIDPLMLPTIFEAFKQGDRLHGGLGLGLAIARAIITLHDGSITAQSAGIGHGTTIRILLPTIVVSTPIDPIIPAPSFVGPPSSSPALALRILLIEDDPACRVVIARLLESKLCYTVHTASTMKEAMNLFEKQSYDLVLSDIGLPDGTGHELLLKMLALKPQQIAIALSGYGMPQDIEKSFSVGFKKHLIKPVPLAILKTAILDVISSSCQ